MRIAIIGAGVAGLSCALELEKHGIQPVVFEKRHRPGELFTHTTAHLNLYSRPYNPLWIIKNKFALDIRPLSSIRTITHKSPNKRVSIKGRHGYFFLRGHDSDSVESQLFRKLKSGINSNTNISDFAPLSRQFDYVVVANGTYDMSHMAGIWSLVFPTNLIGGTVIGKFDMTEMLIWLNTKYCKTAYAYLCPIEKKRAFLGLIVPDSTIDEAREKWNLFWLMEDLPYEQVSDVVVEHNSGIVYPHQVGNVLFAGIAGGFIDHFLGFGFLSAMESGVLAARAIITGRKYENLLFRLKQDMQHALLLRNLFNKVNNKALDIIVTMAATPGIKQLVYDTRIDILKIGTGMVSNYYKLMEKLGSH